MFPKPQRYRNAKILAAAKGERCTIMGPTCNNDPSTTVAAHSPYMEDGKGMGIKADDCFIAFACSSCHDWLDGRRTPTPDEYLEKRDAFHRGMKKTWKRLLEKGVIR